jgi:hypothetical protein
MTCRDLDAFACLEFDDESTSLHRINQDISALEESIARPCTDKVDTSATWLVVILRVHIRVCY